MNQENITVLRKILYAVESGGQDLWATELCSICGRREKYAKRGCDHHRRRSVVRSTRAAAVAAHSGKLSG